MPIMTNLDGQLTQASVAHNEHLFDSLPDSQSLDSHPDPFLVECIRCEMKNVCRQLNSRTQSAKVTHVQ